MQDLAKPEQVELAKKGVREWNEWRKANPVLQVDLSGADLSWASLRHASLRGANLNRADLRAVNLTGACLVGADLREANITVGEDRLGAFVLGARLNDADLSGANLIGAKLNRADLSGANLTEAILFDTDLTEADLTGAILHKATLSATRFTDVDLSEAVGLETCSHFGRSWIGIEAIVKSHASIPESFLRGAGVPEPFITQMKALVGAMSPIQFYSCFISYSSKDQEFAARLHADLQSKGVRCWFAPEDLKIGDKFRTRIDESIRVFDKLLLVLSEHSISSPWVEEEVGAALERERDGRSVLFPIRLDDAVMDSNTAWAASLRRMRHIGDFRKWKDHDAYQTVLTRLMRDLQNEAAIPTAAR